MMKTLRCTLPFILVLASCAEDNSADTACRKAVSLCMAEQERPVITLDKIITVEEVQRLPLDTPALTRTVIDNGKPVDLGVRLRGTTMNPDTNNPDERYVAMETDDKDPRWGEWGGIAAGMSGSPVIFYVNGEWRLAGALSHMRGPGREQPPYPFTVTPIEPMMQSLFSSYPDPTTGTNNTDLEPGSSIGVVFTLGASVEGEVGTLTAIRGNHFLAYGHPSTFQGEVSLPLVAAPIDGIVRSDSQGAKKAFSFTNDVVGRVEMDDLYGIGGQLGEKPELVPVNVTVSVDQSKPQLFKSWMVPVNDSNGNLESNLVRDIVEGVLLQARLTKGGGSADVDLKLGFPGGIIAEKQDKISDYNLSAVIASQVGIAVDRFTSPHLPFNGSSMASVDLAVAIHESRFDAFIQSFSFDTSTLQPGQAFPVTVTLMPWSQAPVSMMLWLSIPANFPSGMAELTVASAATFADSKKSATSLPEAIDEFNDQQPANRLSIRLTSTAPPVCDNDACPACPAGPACTPCPCTDLEHAMVEATKDTDFALTREDLNPEPQMVTMP